MTMKAILTFAGGALAFALAAGPAVAADDANPKKVEHIFIIQRAGDHADGNGSEVHRFRIEGFGEAPGACTGTKDEVNEAGPDGKQRTRIMICSGGQLSAAERADKLEHVLSSLEARDDLSPEQKARVAASLREVIGKLRSGG
jgi:hypothetical protein